MTEKRIYSMPQSFMDDKSVPTHWRLLGYVNGFFLNGNEVFAANSTIAAELKVSERSITTAVARLEELRLVYLKRTKTSRIILPFFPSNEGVKPTSTLETNCEGGVKPTSMEGRNQLLPNSDNLIQIINSDISTDVDIGKQEIVVVKEISELDSLLIDFEKHRKLLKKPMTQKAKELLVKKLSEYSEPEQIRMLEEAIERGWQTVYPAKKNDSNGKNYDRMEAIANYNFT